MKTETEIRAELERLEKEKENVGNKGDYMTATFMQFEISKLRWVLGEEK